MLFVTLLRRWVDYKGNTTKWYSAERNVNAAVIDAMQKLQE